MRDLRGGGGDQPTQEHGRFQSIVADRNLSGGLRRFFRTPGAVDLARGSPVSVAKVIGVALIIAGVVTLNLAGPH
jgi:hypothetical protein